MNQSINQSMNVCIYRRPMSLNLSGTNTEQPSTRPPSYTTPWRPTINESPCSIDVIYECPFIILFSGIWQCFDVGRSGWTRRWGWTWATSTTRPCTSSSPPASATYKSWQPSCKNSAPVCQTHWETRPNSNSSKQGSTRGHFRHQIVNKKDGDYYGGIWLCFRQQGLRQRYFGEAGIRTHVQLRKCADSFQLMVQTQWWVTTKNSDEHHRDWNQHLLDINCQKAKNKNECNLTSRSNYEILQPNLRVAIWRLFDIFGNFVIKFIALPFT